MENLNELSKKLVSSMQNQLNDQKAVIESLHKLTYLLNRFSANMQKPNTMLLKSSLRLKKAVSVMGLNLN